MGKASNDKKIRRVEVLPSQNPWRIEPVDVFDFNACLELAFVAFKRAVNPTTVGRAARAINNYCDQHRLNSLHLVVRAMAFTELLRQLRVRGMLNEFILDDPEHRRSGKVYMDKNLIRLGATFPVNIPSSSPSWPYPQFDLDSLVHECREASLLDED